MWFHDMKVGIWAVLWVIVVLSVTESRGLLQEEGSMLASDRNLLIAVTDSNLDAVRMLLDPEQTDPVANVNIKNSVGSTPLMIAVAADAAEIIAVILKSGADVNLQNADGFTALHFAAQEGHESAVKELLAENPDLELKSTAGATPLYIASQQGHLQVVELLLGAGADIETEFSTGATPILAAAQNGNVPIMKFLLSRQADLSHVNSNQVGAVHLAASSPEGSDAVELAVDSGLSVEAKDRWMDTPLDYAAYFGNEEVVATLLKWGANISALDVRQGLPLDSVCECKRGSDLPGRIGCPDGHCSDEAVARLRILLDPVTQDTDSQDADLQEGSQDVDSIVDAQTTGESFPSQPASSPQLPSVPEAPEFSQDDTEPEPAAKPTATALSIPNDPSGCSPNCQQAPDEEEINFECLSRKWDSFDKKRRRDCLKEILPQCVVLHSVVCGFPDIILHHLLIFYRYQCLVDLFEADCVFEHILKFGQACNMPDEQQCRDIIVERLGSKIVRNYF